MVDAQRFLVVRADDMVLLDLRCSGVRLVSAAPPTTTPVLEPAGDEALVVVTFPPQHVAEEVHASARFPGLRSEAQLSRPSRIAFRLGVGDQFGLSVESILELLNRIEVQPGRNPPTVDDTAIELPWGLVVSPETGLGSSHVRCEHPTRQMSVGPITGLWHTRLRPTAGADGSLPSDSPLLLRPIDQARARDSDPVFTTRDAFGPISFVFDTPLPKESRAEIYALGQRRPPTASRLELSALGGFMDAGGVWDAFEWEHHAAVGRDQWVRTVTKGVLYPFGHRAVFEQVARRIIDPRLVEPVAAIINRNALFVTELQRGQAEDESLRRAFPFDVEITDAVFTGLSDPVWTTYFRPTTAQLDALEQRLRDLKGEQVRLGDAVKPALRPPTDETEIASFGLPGAADVERLWKLDGEIEDLERQIEEARSAIATAPRGEVPSFPGLQALRDEVAEKKGKAAEVQHLVDGWLQHVLTVQEVAGSTLLQQADAARLLEVVQAIADVNAEAEPLRAAHTEPIDVFFPLQTGGSTLPVSVRFHGRNGDVAFTMPMIFVADRQRDPVADLPPFSSITDAGVAQLLDDVWRNAEWRTIPLPGLPVDLVQGVQQQPGDVHEVHALTLERSRGSVEFRPRLTAVEIALPALRSVLGKSEHAVVGYRNDYLANGEAVGAALQLDALDLAGRGIDVNFTACADRSGGLVAPRFTADVISRLEGPVNGQGLASLDPSKLFDDTATLLGIPIKELVADLRVPPAIVPIVADGIPAGVRMQWRGVRLSNRPPLMARPDTQLDLIVETSADRSTTTCVINDFDLGFPPIDAPLVTLTFASLVYVQERGRDPRVGSLRAPLPPEGTPEVGPLKIDVEFGGALDLLKALEERVDLGGAAPTVDVSPSGLTARYVLAVPDVGAGAFVLRNIVLLAEVDVPFDTTPDPPEYPDGKAAFVRLAFASREKPFNLSVSSFGGGGYIDIELDRSGLRRLDASLEFGASLAVNFAVGSAEVHALGGARYVQKPDGSVGAEGFLRLGGSVDVLGLISVAVELVVLLHYEAPSTNPAHPTKPRLVGRATLVIEIDLTLYSDSVELDSGEWELIGGSEESADVSSAELAADGAALDEWRRYRGAFARR